MKSLNKAMDIIDLLAEKGGLGIREISTLTGFPVGTTHRIVATLARRRLLVQNPVSKGYSLSLRFLELGTMVQQQFNLTTAARPHLEALMRETGESANIAVLDREEAVYLDNIRSSHMLQLFTRPGARVPLYATGVGKAFMSSWSDREVKDYLKRTKPRARTPNTIVNAERMVRELARIRSMGYAVDDEEMEQGVRCVAALVLDHRGVPAAAVSISGASTRIIPEKIKPLAQRVKLCAKAISEELGFRRS